MNRQERRRQERAAAKPQDPAPDAATADPRFMAALRMVERTGSREFQLRWQDDEEPVIWIAAAKHLVGPDGKPALDGRTHWAVAAGLTPYRATYALLETLVDGGTCAHCHRPCGVSDDVDALPLGAMVCWTQYDPELRTFRRSCEGET